ncbi:MAG: cytochrome P450 [Ignavibacteria bacterium]|nr:cytochrome P450 [Ignavibacteria bacterium]
MKLLSPSFFSAMSIRSQLKKNPFEALTKIAALDGDVIQLKIADKQAYFINNSEAALSILERTPDYYKPNDLIDPLAPLLGKSILRAEPEDFLLMRDLLHPAFQPEQFAGYTTVMQEEIDSMFAEMFQKRGTYDKLNIETEMLRLIIRFTARNFIASGLEINADSLHEALQDILDFNSLPNIIKLREKCAGKPAQAALLKNTPQFVSEAITFFDDMVDHIGSDFMQVTSDRGTFLQVLYTAYRNKSITYQQVIDQVKTILYACTFSLAETITLVLHNIDTTPGLKKKVETEVDAAIENANTPADYATMFPLLQSIIFETERLYPPHWILQRFAADSDKIGEILIPADSWIIIAPWILHRNNSFGKDPLSFNPERFVNQKELSSRLIPYEFGAYSLPGAELARYEIIYTLVQIIHKSRVLFYKKQSPELTGAPVLHAKELLFTKVERRNK